MAELFAERLPMPLIARVTKAVNDAEIVGHHNREATARAAVATMLNWLGDLPDDVIEAAARRAHVPISNSRKLWPHLLAEIRSQAAEQ